MDQNLNYKGILQEFCQKNKYGMPIYQSTCNGPSHAPLWKTTCSVTDPQTQKIKKSTTKESNTSKTTSEMLAAKILYNKLIAVKSHTQPVKSISEPKFNRNIDAIKPASNLTHLPAEYANKNMAIEPLNLQVIMMARYTRLFLIDIENKPHMNHRFEPDAIYIGFVSSTFGALSKYHNWHICNTDDIYQNIQSHGNLLMYTIEGGMSDLADHWMTAFCYPVCIFLKKCTHIRSIAIVTSDKAGWCTRACLDRILKFNEIKNVNVDNKIIAA